MKYLAVILALSSHLLASPLLLKVTKEISGDETAQIATFDATKYRQLRIAMKVVRHEGGCSVPEKGAADRKEKYGCSRIRFFGGEQPYLFLLAETTTDISQTIALVDSPPANLQFVGLGKGVYTVWIWGQ